MRYMTTTAAIAEFTAEAEADAAYARNVIEPAHAAAIEEDADRTWEARMIAEARAMDAYLARAFAAGEVRCAHCGAACPAGVFGHEEGTCP